MAFSKGCFDFPKRRFNLPKQPLETLKRRFRKSFLCFGFPIICNIFADWFVGGIYWDFERT